MSKKDSKRASDLKSKISAPILMPMSLAPEERPSRTMLNMRWSWESRQAQDSALDGLDVGSLYSGHSTSSVDSVSGPLLDPRHEQVVDTSAAAATAATGSSDSARRQAESHSNQKRHDFGVSHLGLGQRGSSHSFGGRGLSFSEQKENIAPTVPYKPRYTIKSALFCPQETSSGLTPNIVSQPIRKPKMAASILKQVAYIYMDKSAVTSILSTLDFTTPIRSRLFLHTQNTLDAQAISRANELPLTDFLENFVDSCFDPVLSHKLATLWWSIECSLPNGTILIHSLDKTTYADVFIFKFSPVTGVLTNINTPDINGIRQYLCDHPNDPTIFPRVVQRPLTDREKLRLQLGSGNSLATRSMTNLANLLPTSITRRISSSGISSFQGLGNSLTTSFVQNLKDYVVPTLIKWNECITGQNENVLPRYNRSTPNLGVMGEDASPNSGRRPSLLRGRSSQYLKHPLEMLRHSMSSTTAIESSSNSLSLAATKTSKITIPAIVLTTPENESRVLKLVSEILEPQAQPSRTRSFLHSMNLAPSSSKSSGHPTFVYWKDVFNTLAFQTTLPPDMKQITLELNTNISDHVGYDLYRLLSLVTKMYANHLDGVQVDFLRMKLPANNPDYDPSVQMYRSKVGRSFSSQTADSFATALEQSGSDSGEGSSVAAIADKTKRAALDENDDMFSDADARDSLAFTDDYDSDSKDLEEQGRKLSNLLKRDDKVQVELSLDEIEFSTVLISQDEYTVEALLAGWFADAGEWIKANELGWKDAVLSKVRGI